MRILRRRRVERARRRRLPVDDELPLRLVVDEAPADVQGLEDRLEVEPSEAEPALGILERTEPPRRPRVHGRLRDLAVDVVGRARDGRPHPLQVVVRAVDVRLLRFELRMAHASTVTGPRRPSRPYFGP